MGTGLAVWKDECLCSMKGKWIATKRYYFCHQVAHCWVWYDCNHVNIDAVWAHVFGSLMVWGFVGAGCEKGRNWRQVELSRFRNIISVVSWTNRGLTCSTSFVGLFDVVSGFPMSCSKILETVSKQRPTSFSCTRICLKPVFTSTSLFIASPWPDVFGTSFHE